MGDVVRPHPDPATAGSFIVITADLARRCLDRQNGLQSRLAGLLGLALEAERDDLDDSLIDGDRPNDLQNAIRAIGVRPVTRAILEVEIGGTRP